MINPEEYQIDNVTKVVSYQEGFQEKFVRSSVDVVFGGGVLNCGKAQPLYSLVSTPQGFKAIGELKIGDVINDTQSGTQTVLNIYDRGERDVVRLYFDNEAHVDCCVEHLWDIVDVINKKDKTVETSEIIKMLDEGRMVHIPLSNPVHLEQRGELPISPYILGVLLGKPNCFAIHSTSIRTGLKDLNLMGCHSYEKFIPEPYKYTSIKNRTELIRGLFDTDGHQDIRSNRIEYTTTSEKLANDVKWVFESLGGKVSISTKIGHYRNEDGEKVICRKVYRLQCRIHNLNDFVSLERKKVERGNLRKIYHRIVRYEKMDKQPMKCILVSNPNHLYLTDNFIVTHNTFSAILSVAEPSLDPDFRGCFTRRTFGELKTGGGMVDDFKVAYGSNGCKIKETSPPRINFPSGSFVEMRQINDENIKKVTEQWKGAQFDLIYMDELTSYEFSTFKYILTRNRGKAKWTGKFRGTTNPKKTSWVRTFIDWYINPMGQIYPDRDGVIRYFYIMGDDVRDVVWGDSKEEVYEKCKIDIDRKLKALGGGFTYKNMIKSFTFYLGRMSENKASIGNNMDYAGSVAAVGGGQAQQLIEGNWNADEDEEGDIPIPSVSAREVFTNDPQVNGDKWITADLADYGSDNLVALVWDGLHVIDALVVGKSFPKMNADKLLMLATKWDVSDSHIIYDAVGARYMNDYIPDAIPYISNNKAIGMYARGANSIKADCYLRLCWMIREGLISWSPEVAERRYYHQLIKEELTLMTEFCEECSVVRFKETSSGKKRLFTKQEMNTMLGKGRSMDVLDPMAMRMLPFAFLQYGDELSSTGIDYESRADTNNKKSEIYSDSFWA